MRTNPKSKPAPGPSGLSFATLAGIRPADLAPKPAGAGAAAAARPTAWRLFLAGCSALIGLGGRTATKPRAAPARVPATARTAGKATTGPASAVVATQVRHITSEFTAVERQEVHV